MNHDTIVAVFDTREQAEAAVSDLLTAGCPNAVIGGRGVAEMAPGAVAGASRTAGDWVTHFGAGPHATALDDQRPQAGGNVVSVEVIASQAATAIEIIDSHHPFDADERAMFNGFTDIITMPASTMDAAMPVRTIGFSSSDLRAMKIGGKDILT